jgi:mannitol-specific phosphotransferase system IIBC component
VKTIHAIHCYRFYPIVFVFLPFLGSWFYFLLPILLVVVVVVCVVVVCAVAVLCCAVAVVVVSSLLCRCRWRLSAQQHNQQHNHTNNIKNNNIRQHHQQTAHQQNQATKRQPPLSMRRTTEPYESRHSDILDVTQQSSLVPDVIVSFGLIVRCWQVLITNNKQQQQTTNNNSHKQNCQLTSPNTIDWILLYIY